jgi:hypothetical protein
MALISTVETKVSRYPSRAPDRAAASLTSFRSTSPVPVEAHLSCNVATASSAILPQISRPRFRSTREMLRRRKIRISRSGVEATRSPTSARPIVLLLINRLHCHFFFWATLSAPYFTPSAHPLWNGHTNLSDFLSTDRWRLC